MTKQMLLFTFYYLYLHREHIILNVGENLSIISVAEQDLLKPECT